MPDLFDPALLPLSSVYEAARVAVGTVQQATR